MVNSLKDAFMASKLLDEQRVRRIRQLEALASSTFSNRSDLLELSKTKIEAFGFAGGPAYDRAVQALYFANRSKADWLEACKDVCHPQGGAL